MCLCFQFQHNIKLVHRIDCANTNYDDSAKLNLFYGKLRIFMAIMKRAITATTSKVVVKINIQWDTKSYGTIFLLRNAQKSFPDNLISAKAISMEKLHHGNLSHRKYATVFSLSLTHTLTLLNVVFTTGLDRAIGYANLFMFNISTSQCKSMLIGWIEFSGI